MELRSSFKGFIPCLMWKQVEGYPEYEVSIFGEIRRDGKKLNPSVSGAGYLYVAPSKDGKPKMIALHRIVAVAHIPNPSGYPCVNHKDEDKTNPQIDNLEWCTHKQNCVHSLAKSFMVVNPSGEVVKARNIRDFSKDNGLDKSGLSRLLAGKQSSHRGWTACQ